MHELIVMYMYIHYDSFTISLWMHKQKHEWRSTRHPMRSPWTSLPLFFASTWMDWFSANRHDQQTSNIVSENIYHLLVSDKIWNGMNNEQTYNFIQGFDDRH